MGTGFKDKNNIEIKDGDLLKHRFGVVKKVVWNSKKNIWQCRFEKGGGFIDPIEYFIEMDCEII